MNRLAIRTYVRFLIDEFSEEPEGLFLNDSTATELGINDLINTSMHNVHLELLRFMPSYFRKKFLISVTANKREYSIVTDFGLTDFMTMEDIFYNESSSKPTPLLHVELDQINDYQINVGETGDPKIWTYESGDSIAFDPTPNATLANKFKGFYFWRIPDLNHDTSDVLPNIATPSLPKDAHPLIAFDVVNQLHIASEEEHADIEALKQKIMAPFLSFYSMQQGTTWRGRPGLKETMAR